MTRPSIRSLLFTALAACGGSPPPLAAQHAVGPGNQEAPGKVLVFSSQCANMEVHCPPTWSGTVDAIVTSGLSFRGFATVDPATLRKDEASRTETTNTVDSKRTTNSEGSVGTVGAVGLIPVASYTTTKGTTVEIVQSYEKTVTITGATLEDLALEDRKNLMALAGAGSVLTTHIIVGANWSSWSQSQTVEVMIKLSDAYDGTMRWSTRCAASSGDYASAAAAVEAAARCAVDAFEPGRAM